MSDRSIEVFGAFPSSVWSVPLVRDLGTAEEVRIATGFSSLRAARTLLDVLSPTGRVQFLLGLAGCEGPDVVRALQKHPQLEVRGSLVADFHWKAVSIEANSFRALYVGSANFTSKGLSGSGELMVRLTGSALGAGTWDNFQAHFDAFFAAGTTVQGDRLIAALEAIESAGDAARGAQADLENAVEKVANDAKAAAAAEAQRVWFIQWAAQFTKEEDARIDAMLGVCPSDAWTRGEVQPEDARRVRVGDLVLGYDRHNTSMFILGEVGRLEHVAFARGEGAWIADLHQVVPAITGEMRPALHRAMRKVLADVIGVDRLLTPAQFSKVVELLQGEGLLAIASA
jgi:hypothetical protein